MCLLIYKQLNTIVKIFSTIVVAKRCGVDCKQYQTHFSLYTHNIKRDDMFHFLANYYQSMII